MKTSEAIEWLNKNESKARILAISYTNKMKFPEHVQNHIKNCWIKVSDNSDGIYKKPEREEEILQIGCKIVGTKPENDVIEYLLTNPYTGIKMSYAESRQMYG